MSTPKKIAWESWNATAEEIMILSEFTLPEPNSEEINFNNNARDVFSATENFTHPDRSVSARLNFKAVRQMGLLGWIY